MKLIVLNSTIVFLLCLAFIKPLFAIDLSLLGKPAPQFELTNILSNSKAIKLSDYKGKLVLINFWASWCGPCRAELPTLVKIQEKYKDRNFTILGLSVEDKPFIDKFLETQALELNYPITSGKTESSKIMTKYGNPDGFLPYSVLISPRQDILSIFPGILSETKMNRVLGRLLNSF